MGGSNMGKVVPVVHENEPVTLRDIILFFAHFITKVFLYVIFLLLLIICFLFLFYFADLLSNIKSGENKPPLFDAYVIVSPSMVPTIKVQDGIIVQRIEAADLKKGDIISFLSSDMRYQGMVITHRIVGIEKSQSGDYLFRTKGDNNSVEDGALVKAPDIYGRVIFKIPFLGYIRQFLTNYGGWFLCIVVPLLYIIVAEIVKVRKQLYANKQKKLSEQGKNS